MRPNPAFDNGRADNFNAKALDEQFGFKLEGVKRHDLCVGGHYHDRYAMALLRRIDAQPWPMRTSRKRRTILNHRAGPPRGMTSAFIDAKTGARL